MYKERCISDVQKSFLEGLRRELNEIREGQRLSRETGRKGREENSNREGNSTFYA